MQQWEAKARQLKEEAKLLKTQVDIYRKRMRGARELIDEAAGALDSASFAIVTEEAQRNVSLAIHQLRTWLERDERFAALDNLPA